MFNRLTAGIRARWHFARWESEMRRYEDSLPFDWNDVVLMPWRGER